MIDAPRADLVPPSPSREKVQTKLGNLIEGHVSREELAAWPRPWILRHPIPPMDLVVRRILCTMLGAEKERDEGSYLYDAHFWLNLIGELREKPLCPSLTSLRGERTLTELSNDELLHELEYLREQDTRAFAYEDVSRRQEGRGTRYNNLGPDLSMFCADIAGHLSWGRRILEWDRERIERTLYWSGRAFFDRYPKFRPLEKRITPKDTPHLCADVALYEESRETLIELVRRL